MRRLRLGPVAALILALPLLSQPLRGQGSTASPHGANSPSAANASAEQKAATAGYVGSEACQACHSDLYKSWENSPHWKTSLNTEEEPSHQGCEACHGPGSAHIAGGGDVSKIFVFKGRSAKEIDARCMSCHAGGPQHMMALNSIHAQNNVSCIDCHSPHHPESREGLLAKSQPELCYSCHLAQKSQFSMPFHHRVPEGLIQCTDCHNPHGTEHAKQLRMSSTLDAVCFKCHADVQGPFVYEHAPVKVEGCSSCHMVHGSPNPHLLKVSNVNLLCLQCHTASSIGFGAPGTPSFHSQATFFQACTLCHVQIHGSNFSSFFFK